MILVVVVKRSPRFVFVMQVHNEMDEEALTYYCIRLLESNVEIEVACVLGSLEECSWKPWNCVEDLPSGEFGSRGKRPQDSVD